MQQESWPGLREDVTAIRVAVERLDPRLEAVALRLDGMDERLLRLEDRQFQTILAVLGTLTATFGAILAAILG